MASYFQSYFQTSSMPKRLLQYALSRLEILDTDALDLDNLDIAWGKNSTFEFKDVGLRLRKLQALLQLPPSFEVVKARVLLLRLTIPVDIYISPIVVEVDGVECQLRVKEKNNIHSNHDRKPKRASGSGTPRSKVHGRRRGSNPVDDDEARPAIPTAADLAQTFLQMEPEEEKAELEAVIISETQEMGTASVMSDDGESEIPMGTGAALTLPTFMTRFLQGIIDRLLVKIQGVTINLDVEVPNENSRSPPSSALDPVTVQLRVDNIDIEGVTNDLEKESTATEGGPSNVPFKAGKRLICLRNIRAALISEANLFSSLARSAALSSRSSPSVAHSDVFDDRKASRSYASSRGTGMRSRGGASSPDRSSTLSSGRLSSTSLSRKADGSHSLHGSAIARSDSGRFEDAPEEEEDPLMSESINADSEIGDSIFHNSAYLDQVTEGQFDDEEGSERGSPSMSFAAGSRLQSYFRSPLSTPRASIHIQSFPERNTDYFGSFPSDDFIPPSVLQSTTLPIRETPWLSPGQVSQSDPALLMRTPPFGGVDSVHEQLAESVGEDVDSGDEYDSSTPVGGEDLSQSQLFSHEDAQSMYMSAISQRSSSRIPGGWSDSDSSIPGSPPSPEQQTLSLDNLENARQASPIQSFSERSVPSASQHLPTANRPASPPPATATPLQRAHSLTQNSGSVSERSTTSSDEYTRMSKHIFELDRIAVYIPSKLCHEDADISSNAAQNSMLFSSTFDGNASRSTSVNIPGAFSTHLPPRRTPPIPMMKPHVQEMMPNTPLTDDSFEIEVGQLVSHFDISVGRLIWRLVQRIKDALKQDTTAADASKVVNTSAELNVKFSAEHISLQFLERLEGTMIPGNSTPDAVPWIKAPETAILLQTSLKGLCIDTHTSQAGAETAIKLSKFIFGYAQESILSFDANLQIRASVRDLKASAGIDISLIIKKTKNITHIDVNTLPMHVEIDLQRLDETFSWFGGLSSVLNLGSSIASNATVTTASTPKQKARSVRFDTPPNPENSTLPVQSKVDLRIGGFILDLVGEKCSIGLETSAVKVISRDAIVAAVIQNIRLSGPHLRSSDEEPAIVVNIVGTRLEFLPSPQDADLDMLLSLITPSKAKYDQDDDILLDTLLRQRKQGSVLKLNIDDVNARIGRLDQFSYLPVLGEEISRLSTVTKYLPDDDRPGLLSLIKVRNFDAHIDVGRSVGILQLVARETEIAQITLPALVAVSVNAVTLHRNGTEEILGSATDPELREPGARAPAIMARLIGDEMEPIVKIKLWNVRADYRVSTLMAILDLVEHATSQDISASLTASVATLTGPRLAHHHRSSKHSSPPSKQSASSLKPLTIDVVLRDCILGLNPLGLPSQVLVVLTEAHLSAALPQNGKASATGDMSKASVLVIDNVANITSGQTSARSRRLSFDGGSSQVADLCAMSFVSVSYISSAKANIQMVTDVDGETTVEVELRDDLFVVESCADSTQTLIAVLNRLAPPSQPSKEIKYRTKVIPVADLLASLSGDAFGTAEGDYNFDDDFGASELNDLLEDEGGDDFDLDLHYYQHADQQYEEAVLEDRGGPPSSAYLSIQDTHDGVILDSLAEPKEPVEELEELNFMEDHFGTGSVLEGTAHRWNSAKNTYDKTDTKKVRRSPLKVCIRDVHIIWNIFDGYDWQHTRDIISKAVQDVESRAIERRARNERRPTFDQDIDDEETVIGDFLFNSIYIGVLGNRDPRELAAAVNQELNDNATETESIATTSLSASPSRQGRSSRGSTKRLRLKRSKRHKITFELKGVCVDFIAFPAGSGETQSSIDIRVHDFMIFDHIPTSTWKMFATYMQDAGERETGTSMIHVEILNVKPIPELAASEIVLKATVLPLRLHVDQDALDFITRFFEFKDDSEPVHASPSDVPFLQRVEVNSVQVKLDFKPKRVDYAGLRSGHTTEFMNFLILDEADMVLRHTIIYGISGFDKLGKTLNDIWMPDIKRNQLPGILAGLAPVRSIVNIGGGFQHLIVVPMREYKKDGRIVRSISKGAAAFAKTTGTELVKLGAKVAIGVQTVLQGAESLLTQPTETQTRLDDDDETEEESKQISLYANQPVGVLQGLRGGYAGLQRDLILARDAIIAVPGEVMEGGNAAGVLRAVRKHAPTVILRPAIGVAKAGGQILMGATNSLDPVNLHRADAKYKKH